MDALTPVSFTTLALYVGASVVLAIYILRVFLPMVRRLLPTGPDPKERAWELLEKYYRDKQSDDPRYRDFSPDSGTVR